MSSDCTELCKSRIHGDIITAAITKRQVTDEDLCAFLACICCRCESVLDSLGRTALHTAASCGRVALLRWLIEKRQAEVNLKDKESGYTPLHRSIFYGQIHCAIELMKLGASLQLSDSEGLTPVEHAMLDGSQPQATSGEFYYFGSNINNIFGTQVNKKYPTLLDIFHKRYPHETIKQICVDRFHLLILSTSGVAYTSGHGRGGRLGLSDDSSVTTPREVNFSMSLRKEISCLRASISKDHSMFLCSDSNIYSCGSNEYRVLGHNPPPKQLVFPKAISAFSTRNVNVRGIIACEYHSIVWGPEALYVWGFNVGQMGKKVGGGGDGNVGKEFVVSPRNIHALDSNLGLVAASNGATCFYTIKGDVYVLTEYNCKKIGSKLLNLVEMSVIGGKLNHAAFQNDMDKKLETELKVAVMTNTGNVLVWQHSDQQFVRCIYNSSRNLVAKQIFLNSNELLVTSVHGEVFKGAIKPRKKKTPHEAHNDQKSEFHKFLEKEDCLLVNFVKFPRVHRAISVQSDPKGEDYCIIQARPYTEPNVDIYVESTFENLLEDPDSSDVSMEVGKVTFKLHRFILGSSSLYFQEFFSSPHHMPHMILLPMFPTPSAIMEQMIKFCYTGDCDLAHPGEITDERLRELNGRRHPKNALTWLKVIAATYQVIELDGLLKPLTQENFTIINTEKGREMKPVRLKFDVNVLTNIHDISIICTGDVEVKAHKCILISKVDYFRSMFSDRWKNSKVTLPFPASVVKMFLQCLYRGADSQIEHLEIDQLFRLLILADHLLVEELKFQCELVLSSRLTLKNGAEMLTFANTYRAEELKNSCQKFIISNLTAFLESGYLMNVEMNLLRELSKFHCNSDKLSCRVIVPYSVAVSDENIQATISEFSKSLLEEVVPKAVQKKKPRVRRSSSPRKRNHSVSESDNEDSKPSPALGKQLEFITENNEFESANVVASSPEISFDYLSDFPQIEQQSSRKPKHKIVRPPKVKKKLVYETVRSAPEVNKGSPWKTIDPTDGYVSRNSINDIMCEEKQQKFNWYKVSNKLLQYTQLEDQAIGELDVFYNANGITDEIILIERVHEVTKAGVLWISNVR